MNNKIYEPNKGNFGENAIEELYMRQLSPSSAIRVSQDARRWLRKNLDLDVDNQHKATNSAFGSPMYKT